MPASLKRSEAMAVVMILIRISFVILSFIFSPAVFAIPGGVLSSFSTPGDWPTGLAWDGRYLWCADAREGMIYALDREDGSVQEVFPSPASSPQGLAWGRGRLYIADGTTGTIYIFDVKTKRTERWYKLLGPSPRGLAWDNGGLWLVDDRRDVIYKLNPEDGTLIDYFKAPAGDAWGICFDGKYLWVSDRITDEIYMISTDGVVILSFKAPGPFATGLAWDGNFLWVNDFQDDVVYRMKRNDDEKYAVTDWRETIIEFTHRVQNLGPGRLEDVKVYIATPPDRLENQELLEIDFTPQPDSFTIDRWGQRVAICSFPEVNPGEQISAGYRAKARIGNLRYYLFPDKVGTLQDIPEEIVNKYLVNGSKYRIDNPSIKGVARKIIGSEKNPYWIARRIHKYVIENVRYEAAGGWDAAPVILKRGTGSCSESVFLFIALCRAAGLPARFEAGSLIRGDLTSIDYDNHRWAEVYLPKYGWVPFDPSIGGGHSPAGVARAVGRTDVIGGPHPGLFVTTHGGGDSEYLGWNYNSYATYTFREKCNVRAERWFLWDVPKR